MTSRDAAPAGGRDNVFGTLTVLGWSGQNPQDGAELAFLLAYSLGDGSAGQEATTRALRTLLEGAGLPVGGELVSVAETPGVPVTLLVEAGQAVLTMPQFTAQYPAPAQWVDAAVKRGEVYFMFATRPWPRGVPGQVVTEEDLRTFVADEEMLTSSAHCMLPVRTLRR
ncbi:DUF5949 family protein [Streptomyces sp. NPDC059740]|uniref:DUF5949 family protein n=1 Tax=Streptomyces sp. NPDC059740 TaxID=3346926 RepID=UPI00364D8A25